MALYTCVLIDWLIDCITNIPNKLASPNSWNFTWYVFAVISCYIMFMVITAYSQTTLFCFGVFLKTFSSKSWQGFQLQQVCHRAVSLGMRLLGLHQRNRELHCLVTTELHLLNHQPTHFSLNASFNSIWITSISLTPRNQQRKSLQGICLLYTSDAADE